ncbi:MAG: DUF3997 domain-containing protein [Eubacteriales bacterium]|nr:DUF3997 domain-containing protein [Eubacteriales bacterium]
MRKILPLLLCLALLSACAIGPGASDWRYVLPNGYEMWRVNGCSIVIGYSQDDSGLEERIGAYVCAFCADERYVGAQQVTPPETSDALDTSAPRYYLLDTQEGQLYGPYAQESEYLAQCAALGIQGLNDWVATRPSPDGAIYG